jgi:hypothetical protein
MVKSRKMIWAGHVARMGEKRNACGILGESQKKEAIRRTKA